MNIVDKYSKVVTLLCNYYGLEIDNLIDIMSEKENMYLLLLLMKEYNCIDEERIKILFKLRSKRSINYNIRKAEEKLLINRYFRDKYYEIAKG